MILKTIKKITFEMKCKNKLMVSTKRSVLIVHRQYNLKVIILITSEVFLFDVLLNSKFSIINTLEI